MMPDPLAFCALSSKSSWISTVIFRAVDMIRLIIPYSIPVFNMVARTLDRELRAAAGAESIQLLGA